MAKENLPCLLRIRAVPNAKKTQIVGVLGDAIKIKVQAVPEGGRANKELEGFLAELFGIPKKCVSLKSGETSRDKLICLEGLEREKFDEKLRELGLRA